MTTSTTPFESANESSAQLDAIISNVGHLIAETGTVVRQSPIDGTWYLRTDWDVVLHVSQGDSTMLLTESHRGGPEELYFETNCIEAMEKFIISDLCSILRSDQGGSFLLVAPVPLTEDNVAPGFTLINEGRTWKLTENATGHECRGDAVDLVDYSHIARLSPQEIQEAYAAPEGKRPFFPLT